MYSKILVPISFDSDRDSAGALEIAEAILADGGQITLIHVMEQIPSYALSYIPQNQLIESHRAIEAELAEMAASVSSGKAVVIKGHSGRSILAYADTDGTDCIVIASHRPGMQDIFLGSTAAQVVRHAKCAVHVIR